VCTNSKEGAANKKQRALIGGLKEGRPTMYDLLSDNPWLIVIGLGMLVPILGITFGTVTTYLQKTRQAELDASLKHAMLERGMSAEEIVMILEASSRHKSCLKKAMRDVAAWKDSNPVDAPH
jgi:hypothetical protein